MLFVLIRQWAASSLFISQIRRMRRTFKLPAQHLFSVQTFWPLKLDFKDYFSSFFLLLFLCGMQRQIHHVLIWMKRIKASQKNSCWMDHSSRRLALVRRSPCRLWRGDPAIRLEPEATLCIFNSDPSTWFDFFFFLETQIWSDHWKKQRLDILLDFQSAACNILQATSN